MKWSLDSACDMHGRGCGSLYARRGFAGSGDDGSCGLRRGEAHGVSVEKWLYDGGW